VYKYKETLTIKKVKSGNTNMFNSKITGTNHFSSKIQQPA